ncbi:MAG: flavin reductase family protein [Actinomycetota bacterium]|nr:flavin reductase family protein [Actinomycetota bacterium]
MPVGPDDYRQALRRFASGLTVVTVSNGERLHGMTASSFAAVSLTPPLILVSLEKGSRTREIVLEVGSFGVNILSEEQVEVARGFSKAGHKPFESVPHRTGDSDVPILEGTLASLECRIHQAIDAGDHDIVVGEVVACSARDGSPLVYFNRSYRTLR